MEVKDNFHGIWQRRFLLNIPYKLR